MNQNIIGTSGDQAAVQVAILQSPVALGNMQSTLVDVNGKKALAVKVLEGLTSADIAIISPDETISGDPTNQEELNVEFADEIQNKLDAVDLNLNSLTDTVDKPDAQSAMPFLASDAIQNYAPIATDVTNADFLRYEKLQDQEWRQSNGFDQLVIYPTFNDTFAINLVRTSDTTMTVTGNETFNIEITLLLQGFKTTVAVPADVLLELEVNGSQVATANISLTDEDEKILTLDLASQALVNTDTIRSRITVNNNGNTAIRVTALASGVNVFNVENITGFIIPIIPNIYLEFPSQWRAVANDIHNANTGNVGVNTTLPTARLDIDGDLRIRTIPVETDTEVLTVDANGNVRKQDVAVFQGAFFFDTNNQALTMADTLQKVDFGTAGPNNEITMSASEFTVGNTGVFMVNCILEADNTGGGNRSAFIVLQKDIGAGFVDIAGSPKETILGASNALRTGELVTTVFVALQAGDKVRAMWTAENTSVQLMSSTPSFTTVAIPSAVINIARFRNP